MDVHLLMLRYLPRENRFDTSPLTELTEQGNEIVSSSSHFYSLDGLPCCALCLHTRRKSGVHQPPGRTEEPVVPVQKPPKTVSCVEKRSSSRDRNQPTVHPDDRPLYDALKRWRAERAKKENMPAYVYMRNDQMAIIAHVRPKSLDDLKRVSGIGSIKAEKYGQEIVRIVRDFCARESREGVLSETIAGVIYGIDPEKPE